MQCLPRGWRDGPRRVPAERAGIRWAPVRGPGGGPRSSPGLDNGLGRKHAAARRRAVLRPGEWRVRWCGSARGTWEPVPARRPGRPDHRRRLHREAGGPRGDDPGDGAGCARGTGGRRPGRVEGSGRAARRLRPHRDPQPRMVVGSESATCPVCRCATLGRSQRFQTGCAQSRSTTHPRTRPRLGEPR
jgi:hypothetical protein